MKVLEIFKIRSITYIILVAIIIYLGIRLYSQEMGQHISTQEVLIQNPGHIREIW